MMLEHRDNVFRSRLMKQAGPSSRIEVLRLEHRNEILISKFIDRAICADVVLVFFGIPPVHVTRVPLAAESRNRVNTPMNENPELRIPVPFGIS